MYLQLHMLRPAIQAVYNFYLDYILTAPSFTQVLFSAEICKQYMCTIGHRSLPSPVTYNHMNKITPKKFLIVTSLLK